MNVVFKTDVGKIREHNEDDGGIFTNQLGHVLAIVADGMGGHRAGDVASQMTVSHIAEQWQVIDHDMTADEALTWLSSVVNEANRKVFDYGQKHQECLGMGTTLVAAACFHNIVAIVNIGDSRCYVYHQGQLEQLTEDDSLVNRLVQTGQLSEEAAANHPKKNVLLKALGTELAIDIFHKKKQWTQGDMLLLCSDGLSNHVSHDEMITYLNLDEPIDQIAEHLVDSANQAGGDDNITLAIVRNQTGEDG